MGSEGVICNRAYCTNPVCTPSRVSIFSGQYMSRHGAWNVGVNAPEDTVMLPQLLESAGYRSHYIGKAHFQAAGAEAGKSEETQQGWQENYPGFTGPYYGFQSVELSIGHTEYGLAGHYGHWLRSLYTEDEIVEFNRIERVGDHDFGGEAYDWDLPVASHNSVWTADRTLAFLETHDADQPFCLAVGFQDPHHPHCVPRDFDDRVDPQAVPLPDYEDGELDDKPPHFAVTRAGKLEGSEWLGEYKMAGQGYGSDYAKPTESEVRHGRAYYHTMVKLIDREVGRILDGLDRQGLTENTIVIFTTDHGELLGDHGLWLKGPFHYECLVRVPLLIRWPAAIPAGTRIDGLVSLVDLVPTLLSAAGQEAPDFVDGVNALDRLRGEAVSGRQECFVEFIDDPNGLRLKTIVTDSAKLTLYEGHAFGELYDLLADPGEIRNLWDSEEHRSLREALRARIENGPVGGESRLEPRLCYA
jgi:uncharacterized sulfatase